MCDNNKDGGCDCSYDCDCNNDETQKEGEETQADEE